MNKREKWTVIFGIGWVAIFLGLIMVWSVLIGINKAEAITPRCAVGTACADSLANTSKKCEKKGFRKSPKGKICRVLF